MNSEVVKMLNEQIALEFSSAYLYLGFAAKLAELALPGAAHWYKVQAEEEIGHGRRIFDYLTRIDKTPQLMALDAPRDVPESFSAIADAGLAHEKFISRSIEDIYAQAGAEGDFRTQSFLVWFIDEQMEEEENARGIRDGLKRAEGCRAGLALLDSKLGGRK